MPLATQIVDLPLMGGLAEQFDARLVPAGSWIAVKNCRRAKQNGFVKRYGLESVSNSIVTGGALSSLVAMGALNSQLVVFDGTYVYARANQNLLANRSDILDSGGATANSSRTWPVTLTHQSLYGTSNRIVSFDWTIDSSRRIHCAYEIDVEGSTNNAVYEFIQDADTGVFLRGPVQVTANGRGPRIFCLSDNTICLVYCTPTGGAADAIDFTSRTGTSAFGIPVSLVTNKYNFPGLTSAWDCQPVDSSSSTQFVLIYEDNVNVNPVNVNIYNNGNPPTLSVGARWTTMLANWFSFALNRNGTPGAEVLWCAANRNNGGVNNTYATAITKATAVETFAPTNLWIGLPPPITTTGRFDRLTIARISSTQAVVYANTASAFPALPWMARNTITSLGVVGTQKDLFGYGLASRAFTGPDNRVYFWAFDWTYSNTTPECLLGSLFLVDGQVMSGEGFAGRIVARGPMRALDNTANSFFMGGVVTTPLLVDSSILCPAPILRQINVTQYPVEKVKATWDDPRRYRSVQVGQTLYFQPGQQFDGNRPMEIGFHKRPNVAIPADNGAGVLSAGLYQYRCVLRHIGANNEVVRSAPGTAGSVTLAANRQANVTCIFGSFTDRQLPDVGTAQPEYIVAELYRTLANGTTFYLVSEVALPVGSVNAIAFTDNMADTVAETKPALYTGQLAENNAPPNLKSLVLWQNRLCGIGPDLQTIWISSEHVSGEQVTFNELFNTTITGVQLTALAVLDDKLVAFDDKNVYVLVGLPADFLGAGNSLIAQKVSSDVGCVDERGVATHDEGVIFQDRRAFSILTRGLSVEAIGDPVQTQMATYPVVTTAGKVDRDREVRFAVKATQTNANGIVLSYDGNKLWTIHEFTDGAVSQSEITASVNIGGVWYVGMQNGKLYRETTSAWHDGGTFVNSVWESPWIKLDAIGGYQRIRRFFLQMERFTAHDIEVTVYVNGSETPVQTATFTNATIAALSGLPIVRLMVHLAKQKNSYVKFRVRDVTPSSGVIGTGQGMALYGASMEIGIKKGVGKQLSDANKT